ncbi:hypothetical protein BCR36DRAFT_585410 [Piromyces finnis]|uniref:Uncharacterized protein n=1 Tax=Piromyces finnis TaxID=1754191 RepID=A0A1Y1V414_9FUNG|nr:hypothetical protein BCR36DRAFT_585410 [Piromyces finnis]|eukprot:ORX45940.1 hypothetical protein BCR36DRAFT_585410 [Piromyces finnis]
MQNNGNKSDISYSESINQKGDDNKVPSYVSGNNTIIENQNDSSSNAFDESNSNQVIIESQDNFSNTTENEIPKNNVNSVPVGDTTTGFISDDIMIYDQNGNAVGSSSGYAQSTSDSQIRFKLSFSIIILTILVNIIF